MYHNQSNKGACRRGNDEFLRRMLGGELAGDRPVMNPMTPPGAPVPPMSEGGCNRPEGPSCPIGGNMPSLAMVYSPVQKFDGLYSPAEGLENGSLFQALVKPFHGKWQAEWEGKR